tara:strand:- start:110 stop:1120 length:1011 start_codon:yes stop_codon:yes gene_type:complete
VKLLLENWREYLNERKTDEIYARLVDLFVGAYSDDKNFKYTSEEEEIEFEGETTDWAALFDKHKDLLQKIGKKIDPNTPKEHVLYLIDPRRYEIVKKIASADPDEQLYPAKSDPDGEKLPSLLIKFDKDDGAVGRWDPSERQIILFFDKLMDEKSYRNISSDDDVRKIIRTSDYRSFLRHVLEHELTHYLNWVRSGNVRGGMSRDYWRTKKGKEMLNYFRQIFPGSTEDTEEIKKMISYINSTEEIQARLIPVFNQVKSFINSNEEAEPDSEADDLNLIRRELEKDSPDVRKIINHTKNIYDSHFPHTWRLTLDHLKKKTLQRFYQFALQLIEDNK